MVGVAQPALRAHGVVATPALDDRLCFPKGVGDLAIQRFIPEPGVEGLDVAVLPRATRGDVGGPRANSADAVLHGLGDELRPVVGADVARYAA